MNQIIKYFFTGLLPLAALVSCGNNGRHTSAGGNDSISVENAETDTITFTVESISKDEYCQKTASLGYCSSENGHSWVNDSIEEARLLQAHSHVVARKGNTLEVTTKKGKQVFKDKIDRSGMSEDVEQYYLNAVTDRLAAVKVYYYESYLYKCIDLETGQVFETWGAPEVSPGNKMVIAGNIDLMAAFTNNGLQLYALSGDEWKLRMEKILDDWGPQDMYWLDNETVLSKKLSLMQTDSGEVYKTDYVKVLLKKEKVN